MLKQVQHDMEVPSPMEGVFVQCPLSLGRGRNFLMNVSEFRNSGEGLINYSSFPDTDSKVEC